MLKPPAANRNRFLVKNILWNFFGLGSPMMIGLFTIPILIVKLGTLRFGFLTIIWMFISYASLLDLGLSKVLTQQLSIKLAKLEHNTCGNLVWTSVILLTVLGGAVGFIIYFLAPLLVNKYLHIPKDDALDCIYAFYVLSCSLPFVIATNCARGVLESHQAFGFINIVRILMGIFVFIGPLVALSIHNSLAWITLFLMAGKIINCALYFYACFYIMPALFQRFTIITHETLQLLKLGSWLTVSNLVNPLLGYLDRFFIASASLSAVAYYVTPNEMVTKLWLIPSAITAVMLPEFSSMLITNMKQTQILFEKSIKSIFILLFPGIFILIYFAHDLLQFWLGAIFADKSYRVLQWLSLGVLINAMAHIPYTLILAKGKMHLTGILSLIELPLYAMALWLATHYGNIETVAIVWVARMIIDTTIIFLLAHSIIGVSFSGDLLRITLLFGVLLFGLYPPIAVAKFFIAITIIVLFNKMLPRLKSMVFKVISIW